MLTPSLLALAVERASDWGLNVGIVMILCNILAIAIGKFSIQRQDVGPATPIGGMSTPAVFGSLALGHILGAGTILGLTNLGVL
ncbi:photosystem I reaction center subunit PsaK [Leptodesmis sp.]|uniref:photosystem I reaction center subunit PsaK n=1 Tax=Leptodesmis sp. TaxID=3100501 RepID=UPI004053592D